MSGITKLVWCGMLLGAATGCARLRPAAVPRRAALTAASCDTARAVAAERANLVEAWLAVRAGASGAGTNAYDAATRTPNVASAPTASAPPAGSAAATTAAATAAAQSQTSVAIWSAEAAHGDAQAAIVRDQVAGLDARARALPTPAACRAAGLDEPARGA